MKSRGIQVLPNSCVDIYCDFLMLIWIATLQGGGVSFAVKSSPETLILEKKRKIAITSDKNLKKKKKNCVRIRIERK